ncbi:hypothetical protein [Nisaea sediminum]|uniref:hypothetical protein n=1 Tax=Nisaea sediminum TaxID=2775867 RepID=UPI001866FC3C|nr:hypothetical protein [Nisaea sediminum]
MSEEPKKPAAAPGAKAPKTATSGASSRAAQSVASAPQVEGVDFTYFLWLATVATAILSSVSMLLALGIYVLNFASELAFDTPVFASANYMGIMRVTGVFAGMSVIAHVLRLRMVAIANAAQALPFPDEIVASPNTGDPSIDKFECVGRVYIHVYENEIADLILANRPRIKQALSAALVIAISDPVVRYSKDKIEHTLRMGLGGLLPLKSVANVTLSELRHRVRSARPPE